MTGMYIGRWLLFDLQDILLEPFFLKTSTSNNREKYPRGVQLFSIQMVHTLDHSSTGTATILKTNEGIFAQVV